MAQAEAVLSVMEDAARKERRFTVSVSRDLAREVEAAKLLREQILAMSDGDEVFARDAVEGETNVREMIGALTAEDAEDYAQIDGITALIAMLRARRERIEHRCEIRRALIVQGMNVSGIPKLETPAGTVSLRPVPPSAIITEEADIPTRFWKQADPKLDRRAVLDALKEGPVPGATLSNGSETISIRR